MSDARARGERASDFVSDEARRFSRDESAWTDQAADAASRVSRSIHDHGREAKAQVAGLADELGQMVREQPLLVLSIAGVVGYMTAYIVHGRR
jgi:ElaB/YqjD/DUF883 family membrane-anchored ribosome-binding protein